jgi:hypothetical protein
MLMLHGQSYQENHYFYIAVVKLSRVQAGGFAGSMWYTTHNNYGVR